MSAELIPAVQQLFLERLNIDVPSPDTDLFENGLLDSLLLVDLLVQIEQQFDTVISLEELDLDSFRSTSRIAALIQQQHDARPA